MDEENRKGPGVFYAVIGVATLVVAIIGATFAYFTATATATGDSIEGETNNLTSSLSLSVTKVEYENTIAVSNDLVPAVIDDSSIVGITAALEAKCENGVYTGCHVYKIEANTTRNVTNASILLDLSTDAPVKTNWKYLVYQGTENAATAITTTASNLSSAVTAIDLHNDAPLSAGTVGTAPSATYYLMIYLANTGNLQNADGENSEAGSYAGTVTMDVANGQVKATFAD